MEKKKKKGHVAIPFLLAFLLGILLIGGVAMYLFSLLGRGDNTILKMNSNIKKPTAQDNATILFVLDEEESVRPLTFLVARIMPADKQILFFSMPTNMLSVVNGEQKTLAEFYNNGGVKAAQDAITQETQVTFDRYIILDSASFQKICNIFAGVYYQVPADTDGFTDSAEPQWLGPAQMQKLITYPLFPNGEEERSVLVADIISEMINQTDYERIVDSMDSNFKTLINMMETDISALDYDNYKSALKYMYTYGKQLATFRIATSMNQQEDTSVFVLDPNFQNTIAEFFVEAETEE